jgi:hypothetical protein
MTDRWVFVAAGLLLVACLGCSSEPPVNSKTEEKAGVPAAEQAVPPAPGDVQGQVEQKQGAVAVPGKSGPESSKVPPAPGDEQGQVDQKQAPVAVPSKSAPEKSEVPPAPGDQPRATNEKQTLKNSPLQKLDKSARDVHRWAQLASLC